MADQLAEIGPLVVTRYCGPGGEQMLSVAGREGYVNATEYQAYEIACTLLAYLKQRGLVITYSITPVIGGTRP